MSIRPLSANIFLKNKHLRKILEKAALQNAALSAVKLLLDGSIAAQITGTLIKNGILIILVDNQIWATKLRYLSASLRAPLNDQLSEHIHAIQIKVVPRASPTTPNSPVKKPHHPPKALLFQAAMALHDPELSDVLARIAIASDRA